MLKDDPSPGSPHNLCGKYILQGIDLVENISLVRVGASGIHGACYLDSTRDM